MEVEKLKGLLEDDVVQTQGEIDAKLTDMKVKGNMSRVSAKGSEQGSRKE